MVLSAPSAHDEVPPRTADWIEQIRLGLRLSGDAGILIHVDRAVPERLGDLVRGLVGDHPDLDVHADPRAAATVPEGSVMVLLPRAEHAEWLNLERPLFSRRRLKVILYSDHETSGALARDAPDFFDWISQHHDCPPGPVAHAVAGLSAAQAAEAPGIVWRGPGEAELLVAFSAAFPGEMLTWIDPKRDYEELVAAVRKAKDAWIACRAEAVSHVRRLRWAMAEGGKKKQAILVTESHPCPGWWPLHGRLMAFDEARGVLGAAGSARPGALAALAGLEPEAVTLLQELIEREISRSKLQEQLCRDSDPGAALGRLALYRPDGGVLLEAVARGDAVPPLLRAFAGEPGTKVRRQEMLESICSALATGHKVDTDALGFLASSWILEGSVPALMDVQALDYAVEARLQNVPDDKAWTELAQRALFAGEVDVAGVWSRQATAGLMPTGRDLDAMAVRLAALGDHRAAAIRAAIERGNVFFCGAFVVAILATVVTAFLSRSVELTIGAFFVSLVASIVLTWGFWMLHRLYAGIRGWTAVRKTMARLQTSYHRALEQQRHGAYDDAARHLEEILAAERDGHTAEQPAVRQALALLAQTHLERGDDDSAYIKINDALALEGRIMGVEASSFVSLIPDLAAIMTRSGRARDAEALLRKLLGPDVPDRVPGEEPPKGLVPSSAPEADEHLQRFLVLPKSPPLSAESRATALRILAEALLTQGRYTEAEEVLEYTFKDAATELPLDHPERWRTLTTQGKVLALQGRLEQARTSFQHATQLSQQHAGRRHPDTGRALAELARVEHRLGHPEARSAARRALAIYAGAQLADAEKTLVRGELSPIAGTDAA